ncbi:MAG: biotin/lipoate--protein ligase family protein [Alphaproteobacteria bacterium]|nr:biotin/lipoate--protein ligase family protein [Alphaproteobacteria bacterium]
MTERPHFPPVYRAYAITADLDPFDRAVEMAKEGTEAGTLLWSARQDVFECAVVLAPENSLENSLPVLLVASLGLGDALGALIPPVIAVTFGWPDRIEVNGGAAGKIRLIIADTPNPTAIPDWLVIGFNLDNAGQSQEGMEQGHMRDGREVTTLKAEGCPIDLLDLLESFSRHFLAWINRWQGDGVQPVQQAWMSRTLEVGKSVSIDVDGRRREGTFKGLNELCGLELVDQGRHYVIPLDAAIKTSP